MTNRRASPSATSIVLACAFFVGAVTTLMAATDNDRVTAFECFATSDSPTSLDTFALGAPTGKRGCPGSIASPVTIESPAPLKRYALPNLGTNLVRDANDAPLDASLNGVAQPNLRPPEKVAHFIAAVLSEVIAGAMMLWGRRRGSGEPAWNLLGAFLFCSNFGTFLNVAGWTHNDVIASIAFVFRFSWLLIALAILARFTLTCRPLTHISHALGVAALVLSVVGALQNVIIYIIALATGTILLGTTYIAAWIAATAVVTLAAVMSAAIDFPAETRPQMLILTVAAFVGGIFAWPGQFSPTFITGHLEFVQVAGSLMMLAGIVYLVWFAAWTPRRVAAVPALGILIAGMGVVIDVADDVLPDVLKGGTESAGGSSVWLTFTICSALVPIVLKPVKDGLERLVAPEEGPSIADVLKAIDQLRAEIPLATAQPDDKVPSERY